MTEKNILPGQYTFSIIPPGAGLSSEEKGIEPAIMLNASQGPEITNFVSRNAAVSFFAGESDWLPDTIRSIPFSDMQVLSGYHMIVKKGRYLNPLACNFIEEYQAATGGSAN